jgi:hypothetical protein
MAISRCEQVELPCPSCGRQFDAQVWLVVDRSERPDLAGLLVEGKLNEATCPHCSAAGGINHPLLYHDADREQMLCALPLTVRGESAAREIIGDLLRGLVASIPEHRRRLYLGDVAIVAELDGLRTALLEQIDADNDLVEQRLLGAALQALLNAVGQTELERVIAEHRRLLLTERADQALAAIQRDSRAAADRELERRAREARAILGRMRATVTSRRRALADLIDDLAPLTEDEASVLPQLRRMTAAIDRQEVYAARIALRESEQAAIDGLVDRLVLAAERSHAAEAAAFLRRLQALPSQ